MASGMSTRTTGKKTISNFAANRYGEPRVIAATRPVIGAVVESSENRRRSIPVTELIAAITHEIRVSGHATRNTVAELFQQFD
jgi:hypothetical protein